MLELRIPNRAICSPPSRLAPFYRIARGMSTACLLDSCGILNHRGGGLGRGGGRSRDH